MRPSPLSDLHGWPRVLAPSPPAPPGDAWPRVSLVTPSFHQARHLERTLPSMIDQDDVVLGRTRYPEFDFVDFILNRRDLPQPGALLRRSALDRIGLLEEQLLYLMDYELWIRLALLGGQIARIDGPLALYRVHEEAKTEAGSLRSVEERRLLHRWLRAHPELPTEIREQWPRVTGLMHLECARTAIRAGSFPAGLAEALQSARAWRPVLARPALWYQAALGLMGLVLGPRAWIRLRARGRRIRRWRRARNVEGLGGAGSPPSPT